MTARPGTQWGDGTAYGLGWLADSLGARPAASRTAGRQWHLFVHLNDGGQMVSGGPMRTTEHGKRDLPGCGLALKPALFDPQNLGSLGGRVQRRSHTSASASRPLASRARCSDI